VRAYRVVLEAPSLDLFPGVPKIVEPVLVQTLVPELAVEALDVGVLRRFPRVDEVQLDPVTVRPGVQRLSAELPAIVGDDRPGDSSRLRQSVHDPHDPGTGERRVHLDGRALPGEVVHDRQRPELPPVREAVLQDIHRPQLLGPRGHRQRGGADPGPDLLPLPANFQVFLRVDPVRPLVVHPEPFPAKKNVQPTVSEPRPSMRQLPHPVPQQLICLVPSPIPIRRAGDPHQETGPTFADPFLPDRIHSLTALWMRQYFFDRACLKASMSSACSATIRFRRMFSASRPFSRLSSEISMSAYLAFQR